MGLKKDLQSRDAIVTSQFQFDFFKFLFQQMCINHQDFTQY